MFVSDANLDDARKDLASIRALMDQSRRELTATWEHQLLWGTLTITGLVCTWLAIQLAAPRLGAMTWPVLVGLGWCATIGIEVMRDRTAGVRRAEGSPARVFGGLWAAVGVALTMLGLLGSISGTIPSPALPFVVAVLLGAGYFASGHVAGLAWLRRVGVAWWAVGGMLAWMRGPSTLLVLAAAVLVLEVGPALVLRTRQLETAAS